MTPEEATDRLRRIEAARRTFAAEMQAFEKAGGRYVDRARELPANVIANCRFLPNRIELLKLLPKGGVVAEVGTYRGEFAARIMEIAEPRALHVLERDVSRIEPQFLAAHIDAGRCTIHEGDSSAIMEAMPEASFDWIYIDADHSYAGVKKDIAAALPKLKDDGMLVFNDYTVWSISSMSHCGVAKAVNELAAAGGWDLVYFAFQPTMYFDVALRRARG